ncbi:putative BRCA1 C Terminus domain-containing protein [Rosellinia necatrix]|uniref:Putative BRCA1 C Terminus domain-containing protein n=1 Tax=Rosellinia necatrix TaxID=77044 RepID=A0A1S7UJ86_ROSNE|nr:putative BRCA1 C Terminus domain-containing protein [Rosellinia necatrix]
MPSTPSSSSSSKAAPVPAPTAATTTTTTTATATATTTTAAATAGRSSNNGGSSSSGVRRAAEPVYGRAFDPWNSSSTGHQRAENALGASTGWRDSRNRKLMGQFAGGAGGGGGGADGHMSDTAGEGSAHWDPRARAIVAPAARERGARCSVLDMLANPGAMKTSSSSLSSSSFAPPPLSGGTTTTTMTTTIMEARRPESRREGRSSGGDSAVATATDGGEEEPPQRRQQQQRRRIFDGVVVYLNGSTHPLISDHKLRHVLAEHGGSMSSHLGRRKVTHVILGRPAAPGGYGRGAGGGLAGGKLQREISKLGGPGVKYVSVQWVLESIKAGKRLPEARFVDLKIASKGQQSVYGLYSRHKDTPPAAIDEDQPPPSGQA